ncbi:hypothetical protein [Deinococcus sonorensis]|uniref:Uncharacterized protein n=1 Tax=Deinococcus sonorensis TaxID=309891 RepID=A0ABV8Y8D8_9DEIO
MSTSLKSYPRSARPLVRRIGRLVVALTLLAVHSASLVQARSAVQSGCPVGYTCTQPISQSR